jgi:hypothetical protein
MINLEKEYELSDEARYRLQSFLDRFCSGTLSQSYGLGHLLYACHASFPLLLSAELANLIWLNFKNYPFQEGRATTQVDPVAVADLLLSPLCRQVGYQRYEIYPEIRSFLLSRLLDDSWFQQYGIRIEGRERLTDLALFLRQYLHLKISVNSPDGAGFRQLNQWAVQAWLTPGSMAKEMAEAFKRNTDARNEHGQLWLSTQLDKIDLQYQWNDKTYADDENALTPFYRLYYYSQARKEQLLKAETTTIHAYSQEIANFVETGNIGQETAIALPLLRSAAERTQRKINNIQRILVLSVESGGEGLLESNADPANNPVKLLQQAVTRFHTQDNNPEKRIVESVYLQDNQAIWQTISQAFAILEPNEEDTFLFIYSGQPADFTFERYINKHTGVSSPFPLPQIMEVKARTISVIISPTCVFDRPNDKDTIIFATRREVAPGPPYNVPTPFRLPEAMLNALLGNERDLCFKDLFLLLKQQNLPTRVADDTPLLLATVANFRRKIGTGQSTETEHYFLVYYNAGLEYWHVIDEDFKFILLGSTTAVLDYDTENYIQGARGQVSLNQRDNLLLFDGLTEGLNHGELYKLQTVRHGLTYFIRVGFSGLDDTGSPPGEEIRAALDALQPDVFSLWGHLEEKANPDDTTPNNYYGLLIIDLQGSPNGIVYRLTYHSPQNEPEISWAVATRQDIVPSVKKFIRYNYLYTLSPVQQSYVQYQELDITVNARWTIGENKSTLYIRDGKINFNPFEIEVLNHDSFRIYLDIYLLTPDFGITELSGLNLNSVPPSGTYKLTLPQPDLLKQMASEDWNGEIRLLISRDPLQHDFSQTGIAANP